MSSSVSFGHATPILRVTDWERAERFYTDILSFERQWGDSGFAAFRRGEASIMLSTGDQGKGGAWLYLGVDDVDRLHDEIVARGGTIRMGPANYPWGARELHVEDPDGNVIRFGSDATDEPCGEWMDENRIRWRFQAKSGWSRA